MLLPIHAALRNDPTSFSFPRAPRVQPGDAVSSRQIAGLARSFNARLRSGIGDGHWRIAYYIAGLFRQMRNPDGFLWPAQHEFFTAYQMVPPEDGEWPLMGPGEPAGANVANPIAGFIWGVEALGFGGEEDRLGVMPWSLDGRPPSAPIDFWTLGKRQRGGFDASSMATAAPALDAARSWSNLRHSLFGPHATAYGGFLAMPELGAACDDPDPFDEFPAPINYLYKFTGITAEASTSGLHGALSVDGDGRPVVTYAGSCTAYDSDDDGINDTYTDHVAFIIRGAYEYTVFLWDGTIDRLPVNNWVEGPYSGTPRLSKTAGGQLARALAQFCREFRGTAQEQTAAAAIAGAPTVVSGWNRLAFDTNRFLSSQYLLAPARGTLAGDEILTDYPDFDFQPSAGKLVAGEYAVLASGDQSGMAYAVHSDCVVAGVFAAATNLIGPCSVEVIVDGEVAGVVDLRPELGAAGSALWLSRPAAAGERLSLRMLTPAGFSDADGAIRVEIAELLDYKPDLSDLMLTLRTRGALEGV